MVCQFSWQAGRVQEVSVWKYKNMKSLKSNVTTGIVTVSYIALSLRYPLNFCESEKLWETHK